MSDPYAAIAKPVKGDPYADIAKPATSTNTGADVLKSFGAGVGRGVAALNDFTPAGITTNLLNTGMRAAGLSSRAPTASAMFSESPLNYQPETRAGRYAGVAGEMVPNAAAGGSGVVRGVAANLLRRGAQVVLPAIGSEAAREVASAAGAGPTGQAAASVAGAAVGGVASAAKMTPRLPKPRPKAPTLAAVRAEKDAAYSAVDKAGVAYKPQAFNQFADVLETTLQRQSMDPMRHPKAASMAAQIERMRGKGYTLTELDQLRQVIRRDVASAPDASERRLGQIMINRLDKFIDGAGSGSITSGDPQAAAGMIRRARDLNTRVEKAGAVEKALDKAQRQAQKSGSGGNIENATRQRLDALIDKTKGLTPQEEAAFRKVVAGTPLQNAFRQIGKLSPSGSGLMMALHGMATLPTAGMNWVVAGAGVGAKAASEAMARNNVQNLQRIILEGGRAAPSPRPSAAATATNALRRAARLATVPAALATTGASRPEDEKRRR